MAVAVGERRIVAVLIADIVGSTQIGEQLGPERSKFLFDEVVRLMTDQIRRYDGTVAQLVGDQVFAIFGAPIAHEDDSERAVRAALAIQRAVAQYAKDVDAAYDVRLAVRIAVNTGPVVVNREGEDELERWNALGDTVNVAARLEKLAGEGGILVGQATARQIEHCFVLEHVDDQELRGKSAPVGAFKVTGLREIGPPEPRHSLVGRDFELTVLERVMEGLVEGRGAIAAVIGEPGIGKTRLAIEARNRFRDRVHFVEGRAVSYAQNLPYWPIRDLLREWLGVGATTPEARVRLDLKAEVAHLFGQDADDVYPFFASLLGLALEPEAAGRLHELNRESIQRETFDVFSQLLCKLADEQPL